MKPYLNPQSECLIRCQSKTCNASTCCSPDLLDDHHHEHHHHHHHHSHQTLNKKFDSKEILPSLSSNIDLTKYKININEISEVTCSNPDVTMLSGEKPSIKLKAISASELTVEAVSDNECDNNGKRTVSVDVVNNATSEELTIIECKNSKDEQNANESQPL